MATIQPFEKRLNFVPPQIDTIALVGCGGTGGYLAQGISRLLYHEARRGRSFRFVLVDHDKVEEKNVGRQNFCSAEIGRYKADALAVRFSRAYGLNIESIPAFLSIDGRLMSRLRYKGLLVIGAVDNTFARKAIDASMARHNNMMWLDCGNERDSGQVLIGTSMDFTKKQLKLSKSTGFLETLPLPSRVHPELIDTSGAKKKKMSCAEIAAADAQGMIINQAVAAVAGQYVYEIIQRTHMVKFATYLNLPSGSARSLYTTVSDLEPYAGLLSAEAAA